MAIATKDSLGPTSDVLREATARAHERAERSAFVTELMDGRLDADAYVALAGQLLFVYRALESAGDRLASHPVAAAVLDERLRRTPSLESDLVALGVDPVSYTHLRAHATVLDLVCRLLLATKNNQTHQTTTIYTITIRRHTTNYSNLASKIEQSQIQ